MNHKDINLTDTVEYTFRLLDSGLLCSPLMLASRLDETALIGMVAAFLINPLSLSLQSCMDCKVHFLLAMENIYVWNKTIC